MHVHVSDRENYHIKVAEGKGRRKMTAWQDDSRKAVKEEQRARQQQWINLNRGKNAIKGRSYSTRAAVTSARAKLMYVRVDGGYNENQQEPPAP